MAKKNKYEIKEGNLYCNDSLLVKNNDIKINIYSLFIEDNTVYFEFNSTLFLNHVNFIVVLDDSIEYKCEVVHNDKDCYYYAGSVKLINVNKIDFYLCILDLKIKCKINFLNFSRLNNSRYSFYKKNNYLLTHKNNSLFINSQKKLLVTKYLLVLLLRRKEVFISIIYLLYYLTKPFIKKNIWLISDREEVGGDNGEALFKYICESTKKKNVYFCLSKNSKDLERLRSIGKVVYFGSLKFYLLYLNCEFMISSHADSLVTSPFGWKQMYFSNINDRKFVFLQHGVTVGDLSGWLKKSNKNISLLTSCSIKEYDSFLNGNYMYDEKVIKLTGFARIDKLKENNVKLQNLILLSPTWRHNLVGKCLPGTQLREYNVNFKNSEYFKFYSSLINNKKLLKSLKKNNYKILFCLHPSFKSQINDFKSNDLVEIKTLVDYSYLFKSAKLLITDYSSVAFDFAYLKKPVIYSQFDKEKFEISHTYTNGCIFNFENDGFGDIVHDVNSVVNKTIELIENDCKMPLKYKSRVTSYFKYTDNKNCERIYNEIIKLSKNR